jgi:hypothetical protein
LTNLLYHATPNLILPGIASFDLLNIFLIHHTLDMARFFFFTLPLVVLATHFPRQHLLLSSIPTPSSITPCTVGNDGPCLPSSTCTPTMISDFGLPQLGQCIATNAPPAYSPSPSPELVQECQMALPPSITQCGPESSCIQTDTTCNPGGCFGECVRTATPTPTPYNRCQMALPPYITQCGSGSSCIQTDTTCLGGGCFGECMPTDVLTR